MQSRFLIFLILSLSIIWAASYAVYRTYTHMGAINGIYSKILFWLLLIMPILFIGTTAVLMRYDIKILSPLYIAGTTWLPVLTYLFISSIIIFIITIFLPHSPNVVSIYKTICYISLTVIAGLITYGIINAQTIRFTNITVPEENRLSQKLKGKKIILLADTHIGNVNNVRFLNRVVSKINQTEADAVLIAGDLVDGPTIDFEKSLEPLSRLNKPVYYTPGNHEIYSEKENELYSITDKHTMGLRNQKTDFLGIKLIGLNYDANEDKDFLANKLAISGFRPEEETIIIHHDPTNNKFIQESGADLIVSGHTHGGQFWPFTAVVKRIYGPYSHGIHNISNTSSITTWGAGTWGPSVRIGTKSEIIIIDFK